MVAVFDYPARGTTPAFNLTLKVNFVDGGVTSEWGEAGFRFVGNEGLMELGGGGVTRLPSAAPLEGLGRRALEGGDARRGDAPEL